MLTALSAVNSEGIIRVGLRGGPLQESKRRWMGPLMYMLIVLTLLSLGFTVYGTYLASSSHVQRECWDSNPCNFIETYIPVECTNDPAQGPVVLSPACQVLIKNIGKVMDCEAEFAYHMNVVRTRI